ncbi:MAG: 3-oxoacyl-[acyl-carrier-protein] reductase [Clostridia bacterium]|nr:3-oxoacyl-[acyl-carrier-protein] reductase [Clostridia bacterium]
MLKGLTALVTGSSRGIGRAIAIRLAQEGAAVGINYNSNKEAAVEVLNEIQGFGGKAALFPGDVADGPGMAEMTKKIKNEFGGLDILVNNAGVTRDGLLLRMKEEDWQRVIETNLTGVYNCTKAALRYILRSENPSIINISSVVGQMGNAGQSNYAAAKAGIMGFTKSMARELASKGVRVNAVAPGFIETDMTSVLPDRVKEKMLENIPLGRLGKPGDVANLTLFLASPNSKYITGQIINVDGGMVMT